MSVTTEGATRSATLSQVYVTGLACGASDVTGLCHRFGMWCVRCHRFMSPVWHVVRQMSQVYVTGLACGASDVTGLACGASDVTGWHVVRQMSQVYVTGLAFGASDVTGLCHRFGMWCVRCHRFMSQVWHVVRCHRFGMFLGVCASDVMSRNVKTASQCLSGYVVQVLTTQTLIYYVSFLVK